MKIVPLLDAGGRQTRHAAVVVEHPLLRVTESAEPADPGAIADALELVVRWAVRAHRRCNPSMEKVAETAEFTAIGAGEPT
jgi:hypothetical protein